MDKQLQNENLDSITVYNPILLKVLLHSTADSFPQRHLKKLNNTQGITQNLGLKNQGKKTCPLTWRFTLEIAKGAKVLAPLGIAFQGSLCFKENNVQSNKTMVHLITFANTWSTCSASLPENLIQQHIPPPFQHLSKSHNNTKSGGSC